ncbi:MAG: WYL domain-containing protein, partial [Egibacteraceae bacterium]
TRAELLAAMRAVGWVGASDLENRLRDLRRGDRRCATALGAVALRVDADRVAFVEPFPVLEDAGRRALAFVRYMTSRIPGPLAAQALAALDGLLPGVAATSSTRAPAGFAATARTLAAFEQARADRRPVRMRYHSTNSGYARDYDVVPVEYVTLAGTVKALCVPVDAEGRRAGHDGQFLLDRIQAVTTLSDWTLPDPDTLALERCDIVVDVTDGLFRVLRERNLLGVTAEHAAPDPTEPDLWRVRGSFPAALAWDVMEQLCAWAGNAQVHAPLWLVNAVCRRLRAGLHVMEHGDGFQLVKPEPHASFADLGDAVHRGPPLAQQSVTGRARRLLPRRI